MEDDDAGPYDAAIERFGNQELVTTYGDPERIQQLLDAGNLVTANAILAACYTGNERTLELLLSARPDAEVRSASAGGKTTGAKSG